MTKKDPHVRILDADAEGGPALFVRFIEDNDRGDEDPSELPSWSIFVTALDPITMAPYTGEQISFTYKVIP